MFSKEKSKDIFLLATEVDNVFLSEYLPDTPGDYVKVYLYGLFLCQNSGSDIPFDKFAKKLNLKQIWKTIWLPENIKWNLNYIEELSVFKQQAKLL